jgi:hypothetical protein
MNKEGKRKVREKREIKKTRHREGNGRNVEESKRNREIEKENCHRKKERANGRKRQEILKK